MDRVASSFLLLLWILGTGGVLHRDQNQNSSQVLEAVVFADLSAVFRRVDPRFLSITIDASLAADEKFMFLLRWVLRLLWGFTPAPVNPVTVSPVNVLRSAANVYLKPLKSSKLPGDDLSYEEPAAPE